MRLKLHDNNEDSMENSATNAAAFFPFVGIAASRQIKAYTGRAVASAYPLMMIMVICIVKATRSQNPAPNH